jgi:hypothetical protein
MADMNQDEPGVDELVLSRLAEQVGADQGRQGKAPQESRAQ